MNTDITKNDTSDMICVAAIAGAVGVKGEVKLKSFTDVPEDCLTYGPLMDAAGLVILTPIKWHKSGKFLAVRAPEVSSREQAISLKSTKLYVSAANLPEPDEDEFYYRDLVGLRVETEDGAPAGKVTAVHEYGAGDMVEIKPVDGKSYYHPFTKLAVPRVDVKAGFIVIVPQIAPAARRQDEED